MSASTVFHRSQTAASPPAVDVFVMAYNHEPYIRECLDNILGQETGFPVRIIIGEDESKDGTRGICREYAAAYPDRILLLEGKRSEVIYINGVPTGRRNWLNIMDAVRAKYLAFCDADDYWTDPTKLQRQVDLLEAHPEYAISFHKAVDFWEKRNEWETVNAHQPEITDFAYLARSGWFMRTASVVFRTASIPDIPEWFKQVASADYSLQLLTTHAGGKIHFLDRPMCVYRRLESGISQQTMHGSYLQYIAYSKRQLAIYRDHLPKGRDIFQDRIDRLLEDEFQHLRIKEGKTPADWAEIARLFFRLGKYRKTTAFVRRKLSGTGTASHE